MEVFTDTVSLPSIDSEQVMFSEHPKIQKLTEIMETRRELFSVIGEACDLASGRNMCSQKRKERDPDF
jgi:hypothetical protein